MEAKVNNCETKTIRKSVKVNVRNGVRYIVIYEVHGVKTDGTNVVIDRYLDKKSAEREVDFVDKFGGHLYSSSYVYEQWVWC